MQNKIKVGVLYGGRSVEHEISIKSALNVIRYFDKSKFEITPIKIDKNNVWHIGHNPEDNSEASNSTGILLDAKNPMLFDKNNVEYPVDIIFPVLHGTDGEDGSIQGLLKALDVPCAGSSVLGSAVAMDKVISKKILETEGVPVCKYLSFSHHDKHKINFEEIEKFLKLPFIAKPANLGSSVGVSKIKTKEEFKASLEEIFHFDNKIILEEFVEGREFECAILGNMEVKASCLGEIVVHDNYEFYDYEAKYQDKDATKTIIPANITPSLSDQMKDASIRAYKALECNDFARVDIFLSKENKVYVNEINTIPGFTDISMFPSLWKHEGINYTELLTEIINLSLKRNEKKVNRHFEG